MPGRLAYNVQVALLAIATALGAATLGTSSWALVNMQWALIGLPVAAASASALAYGGRSLVAAFALAVGVAAAAVLNTWSALYAVPAVLAVLGAIVALRRVSYVAVSAGLVAVFAAAGFLTDTMLAVSKGHTLATEVVAQGKAAAAQVAATADPQTGAQFTKQIVELYQQTVSVLPSVYFLSGMLLAIGVVAAIAWSARRLDVPVTVPAFDRVDLPPVIVIGAVVGLLAAGLAKFASAGPVWSAVGTNFIACTGFLLMIQGLAVYSALLKRVRIGTPGRVLAYVVLIVLDALVKIVTLTGLADMWLNFRRLPREGHPDLPLEPATSHGDDASTGV